MQDKDLFPIHITLTIPFFTQRTIDNFVYNKYNKNTSKVKKLFFAVIILSVIGIILAVFLMYEQLFQTAFKPCTISSTVNCDAIISGPVAKTLGIPTPLIGLAGYVIILLSSIFQKKKLMLFMSTFGLIFCLWIGYRDIFELHTICPVCIGCQIVMTSVFVLSLLITVNKKSI